MRKLSSIVNKYVFNDFQLSDYRIRRWYIAVDSEMIVQSYIKFPIYLIFRIFKEPRVYEVPLSSSERLLISESILKELK